MQDLDMRNQVDENERSVEEISRVMGFGTNVSAIKQASILHAVYDWANIELQTLITSQWDAPLSLDGMLKFMTEKAQPLDKALIKALADAARTDEGTIRKLYAESIEANSVHGSDSDENAAMEIAQFFKPEDIVG